MGGVWYIKKYCRFKKDVYNKDKIIFHKNDIFEAFEFENDNKYYFRTCTRKDKDGNNLIDFGISKNYEGQLFILNIESKK